MVDQTRDEPGAGSGPGARFEESTGNAGAEFRLLVEALAYRAEEFLHGLAGTAEASDAGARHEAAGARDACPMCAVLAVLRGERPELTSTLVEQLAALLAVVRRALSEHERVNPHSGGVPGESGEEHGPAGDGAGSDNPAGAGRAGEGPAKVQHIDVQRVRGNVVRQAAPAGSGGERAEGAGC